MTKNKIIKLLLKIIIGSVILIIILLILFFVYFFGTPFDWKKHDQNLLKFAEEFDLIPLPPNSKQLGSLYKEFGLLSNGNHCDYYISKLIETDLSETELQVYYKNITIPPVDANELLEYSRNPRGATPNIIFITQPWIEAIRFTKEEVSKDHNINPDAITDKTFLISTDDRNYIANDLRCN